MKIANFAFPILTVCCTMIDMENEIVVLNNERVKFDTQVTSIGSIDVFSVILDKTRYIIVIDYQIWV